jgi:hypothetical protein
MATKYSKVDLDALDTAEMMQLVKSIAANTQPSVRLHSRSSAPFVSVKIQKHTHRRHNKRILLAPVPPPSASAPLPLPSPGSQTTPTAADDDDCGIDIDEFIAELELVDVPTVPDDNDELNIDKFLEELTTATARAPPPPPPPTPVPQPIVHPHAVKAQAITIPAAAMDVMLGMATANATHDAATQSFERQLYNAMCARLVSDAADVANDQTPASASYMFKPQNRIRDPRVVAALNTIENGPNWHPTLAITDGHTSNAVAANMCTAMDIIRQSNEVAQLQAEGATLQCIAGKMMVVQDPRQSMSGDMQHTQHVCDPEVCIYAALVDITHTDIECRTMAARLRLDGIVVDDIAVDPTIGDIYMCTSGGGFHDCRDHTCCDSVPMDGAYVCWKSGRVHGQDMRSADPSRFSTDESVRSGDGTAWHLSGWAASQQDTAAYSYAVGVRSQNARKAAQTQQYTAQLMSPLTNAPWVKAAEQAIKRRKRMQNNVSHVIVETASTTNAAAPTLEVQIRRPTHRGKLCGSSAMARVLGICRGNTAPGALDAGSQTSSTSTSSTTSSTKSVVDTTWEDGPLEQHRLGGSATDKRRKRTAVLLDSDGGEESTAVPSPQVHDNGQLSGLNLILDRVWLRGIAEAFSTDMHCKPYLELLDINNTGTSEMSKAADFAIQEIAIASQIVKFMFVTLPLQYHAMKRTGNKAEKTVSLTTDSSNNWCDIIVRKYTAVVMKCWILLSASHHIDRETNCMIANLMDHYSRGTPPPPPPQSPAPSLAFRGSQTPDLSGAMSALLITDGTSPVPNTPPPAASVPKFNHCALGVLYLTATGYEVPATMNDLPRAHDWYGELAARLAPVTEPTFATVHKMQFLLLDALANMKLVPETNLAKVCKATRLQSDATSRVRAKHSTTVIGAAKPFQTHKTHLLPVDSGNLPSRIDCQAATTGRSVVQARLREIATWSQVKFVHDIIVRGVDATAALQAFDTRATWFLMNTSHTPPPPSPVSR